MLVISKLFITNPGNISMLMNDIKNVLYIGINLDKSKSVFMVIPKARRTI